MNSVLKLPSLRCQWSGMHISLPVSTPPVIENILLVLGRDRQHNIPGNTENLLLLLLFLIR
jgi:hypothetical protein